MPRLNVETDLPLSAGRRSSFYWKLSSSFAVIVLLGALFVGLLVRYQLGADLREELESSLQRTCQVLAPYARDRIMNGLVEGPDVELGQIGLDTRIRLTWIELDGRVVADTHADARLMDNHASRWEVREALAEGFGKQSRASSTIGREMLYVAYCLEDQGEKVGVIRAAMPLDDIREQVSRVDRIILFGAGLGALGAGLCGLYAASRITRPITSMMKMAEAVRQGDYDARTYDLPRDEIGLLGEALNALSTELTRQLADSSLEQDRLRAVLAGMVEGVVAIDDEERLLFSNLRARKFLGFGDDVQPDSRLWEITRVSGLDDLIQEARRLNGPARKALSIHRDSEELILDAHATTFGTDSSRGIALVLHDVTELRRLEVVRTDFVANVSHELKTPLTAIQGFVETLLAGAVYEEKNNVRFLEKVEVHVHRLIHLVSDLLSLARIESSNTVLEEVDVELGSIISEVIRDRGVGTNERGQTICVLGNERAIHVRGDRESLIQIVGNLLENAIKYSPNGAPIELEIGRSTGCAFIEVRDRGIGIPDGDVDRVFERFYRVDKARSRDLGGTGLGLSIVKNLVVAMDGRIELKSQLGVGSTFRVELVPAFAPEP
ncbi:MAG: two-component system phosphate regulon sensor histidine kinase PhoR [Planctomycetota bacterium]|jgi:two-component system phosphate regulon sensor histidine kinase PhoR